MDDKPHIDIPTAEIAAFCAKWKVREFSLFGSVLRDDFTPDSDIDAMVVLDDAAPWSLYEWLDMIDELQELFGRHVDLVEKCAIRNPFRRRAILQSSKIILCRVKRTTMYTCGICSRQPAP
jgi:hypothetical protein